MEDDLIECRSGKLLLLLPSLQAIAQQLVEDVQLARLFGLVNVDSLMEELILNDMKPSDPQGYRGTSHTRESHFVDVINHAR
uniref:NR LBD domain-containing protein n=1 Tax=Caenorhabditis tropicalis TaxID=1561998 RepID=A0A1I7U4T5_9PELO